MSSALPEPEFSRPVDVSTAGGRQMSISADEAEREALATRFGLVRVRRLEANVSLEKVGDAITATGTMIADFVQSCAVSAEDLPVSVEEPVMLRFVQQDASSGPEEEIEIGAEDCDEIAYSGARIDVGEAIAQSLGLAIDPYATGPDAEAARKKLGDDESAFAALKDLDL